MPFLDSDGVAHLLRPRTVVETEALGGAWAPVVRATLDDGSSVVVKERRPPGGGWGHDLDNLRNERAALETLGEVGAGFSPAFLAGDDELGVLVMSDLGRGPTVEELLLEPTAGEAAASALVEHGRALARLHGATATPHAEAIFVARRRRLGRGTYEPARARTHYASHDLRHLWAETAESARALGFTPPDDGASADLDGLLRELAAPGPFLALTNLDASPQNVVLAGGRAWIVDFEGAGMRHLALDACMLRFPFPNYGHWAILPEHVRAAMESAYRKELVASGVGAAEEDAAYDRAMAIGCASTVVLRIHRLPRIADDDEQAERRRTQMVSAIDVFCRAAADAAVLHRLAAWFAGLADEMRARWSEASAAPREFPALPLERRLATP